MEYPVPVGTPLISPYIKWDHSQDWDVPKAEDFPSGSKGSASASVYNIGMFVCSSCSCFSCFHSDGEKKKDSGLKLHQKRFMIGY